MKRVFAATAGVVLFSSTVFAGDLTGTTMELIINHTGQFGRPVGGEYEYGTSADYFDTFGFSWNASSPAGFGGFQNSILVDMSNFAYTDFPGETATVTIDDIDIEVAEGSVGLFNGSGDQIGFNLSGGGGSLSGQYSTDDILNDDGVTLFIAWDSGGGGGCVGDIDDSGDVGTNDLILLLGAWGTDNADADLDGSGDVGTNDLIILLGAWGPCK